MFFSNRQMTGNPFIDRMITKRDHEHAELMALREELKVLQDNILNRQLRLNKMNKNIIRRSQSARYLRVLSNTSAPMG